MNSGTLQSPVTKANKALVNNNKVLIPVVTVVMAKISKNRV